jgi:hypothetical protein
LVVVADQALARCNVDLSWDLGTQKSPYVSPGVGDARVLRRLFEVNFDTQN